MIASSSRGALDEDLESACWRLDDGRQTIAFASSDGGLPEVIYWGAPLPEFEDLVEAFAATRRDLTSGTLDALPPISLCPEAAMSFPGQPGVVLDDRGVPLLPRLRLSRVVQERGALVFIAVDAAIGLTYTARIATSPAGLLALSATVETDAPVRLHWLSAPVLPGPDLADHIVDVAGRWLSEFQLVRTPWAPGIRMREARTGRSGHEHFPGALFPCRGATNTSGEVYAMHYGWSGGHRMVAEELPDGRRQVQFGHAVGSELVPGCRFETATLYATWSGTGINGAAVRFQRHLRGNLVPWSDRTTAGPKGPVESRIAPRTSRDPNGNPSARLA
jgi:alpha-galactosidase